MSQLSISREVNAVKILGTFKAFDTDPEYPLIWSNKIIAPLAGLPIDEVAAALYWLSREEYIHAYDGKYFITADGHDYLYHARSSTKAAVSAEAIRIYKEEALSGLHVGKRKGKTVTSQSKITTAALPTIIPKGRGYSGHHEQTTPEDIMIDSQEREERIKLKALELGVSSDELKWLFKEKRYRHCRGCLTMGIFDDDAKVCRKCTEGGE